MTVCHYVYHYNDTRSTVTRQSFDNDKRHVTAFYVVLVYVMYVFCLIVSIFIKYILNLLISAILQ